MNKIATLEQPNSTSFLVPMKEGLTFLEQLTVLAVEGRCSNPKVPYLYHVDKVGKITFARGACKMWSCPQCAMKNTKRWIARIIDGINKSDSDAWHFATVTAHKWWRGEKSLINLRSNWHKLRKRMARKAKTLGVKMEYVRVWEHHKDGSYHMHIINNVGVNTKWLKDSASECGMGFMAHSDEIVNAGQAAGYVAKYMLKQSEDETLHSFPKGARRIEVSQNWVAWHEKKSEDWNYSGDLEQSIGKAKWMKHHGNVVHDLVLRRDKKRRKTDYDKRTNSNGRGSKGYPRTGKLASKSSRGEKVVKGKMRLRQKEYGTKPQHKTLYQDTCKRVEQPSIKDERILRNVQDKTGTSP